MTEQFRPIGYWVRHLDHLIEDSFDRMLGAHGLTRRHWQVLNVLRGEPTTERQLNDALEPFHRADEAELPAVLGGLEEWGWTRVTAQGRYALTAAGERAHAEVRAKVIENRAAFLRGFSDQEYRDVVGALERMAANLEPATP